MTSILKENGACKPLRESFVIPPNYNKRLPKKVEKSYRKAKKMLILFSLCIIIFLILIKWFIFMRFDSQLIDPDLSPDYALDTAGATIYGEPNAVTYSSGIKFKLFNVPLLMMKKGFQNGPETILKPKKSPGECWPIKGNKASVRIKLSHVIYPTFVTLEHIAQNVNPANNTLTAPKDFAIYALDLDLKDIRFYLGTFHYKNNSEPIQTFKLNPIPDGYPTNIVEFELLSNHGHPAFTCIYKIRVHGLLFN